MMNMTKLSYEEWEKWFIDTKCTITEEEIENLKTKYYCGLNTYEEFKSLLKHEYECYCKNEDTLQTVPPDPNPPPTAL